MRYIKGFTYMNKPYGWKYKQLYKLPYKHPKINRWYNLLKVAKWEVNGKHIGFILGNHKKSFKQLYEMTHDIDVEIKESECKDVPF